MKTYSRTFVEQCDLFADCPIAQEHWDECDHGGSSLCIFETLLVPLRGYVENFLECCEEFLPGEEVELIHSRMADLPDDICINLCPRAQTHTIIMRISLKDAELVREQLDGISNDRIIGSGTSRDGRLEWAYQGYSDSDAQEWADQLRKINGVEVEVNKLAMFR